MKPLLCYLPDFPVSLDETRSSWVKRHIQMALDADLTPALLPTAGLTRLTVAIAPDMATRIAQLAAQHNVAEGRMAGMLVLAVLNRARSKDSEATPPQESSTGDRREQRRIIEGAVPLLSTGKIVIIEAGTGVGKSRIAGRIAQELWREDGPQVPIVVSTPTVAQLAHLARELKALGGDSEPAGGKASGETDYPPLPKPTFVLGRSQFIDLDAALAMAHVSENAAAVAWLEAGAPAGLTESTSDFKSFVPGICGLMEDWLSLTGSSSPVDDPDFDPSECALHEDSSEESLAAYKALRASAHQSPVILCTHAMVGVDLLGRSLRRGTDPTDAGNSTSSAIGAAGGIDEGEAPTTILPPNACYIIDEAHMFEQEVANVASRGVSLHSLAKLLRDPRWSALRVTGLCADGASAAEAAIASLRTIGGANNRSVLLPANLQDPHVARTWAGALTDIARLEVTLSAIITKTGEQKKRGADTSWSAGKIALMRARRAIRNALTGNQVVEVSTSPVRRYATLTTGPSSVNWLMGILWGGANSGVVMSGTLLLPTFMGLSSGYIKEQLQLPDDRTVMLPAVHPPWTLSSQTMMLPAGSSRAWLTPPPTESATPEQMTAWMQYVSRAVMQAAETAAGGILVLLSGYDRIHLLNQVLPASLAGRLVVQGRSGPNLMVCQERFREMHAQKLRPIWLATGGAWTGLDLRDRGVPDSRVEDDTLLTDVIIPNAPFGMNRSTTHASRCRRLVKFEAMSTALILRQGLGRLVRRQGLLHRRLWVLDARLLTREASNGRSMFQQCALMLDLFEKQELFSFEQQE